MRIVLAVVLCLKLVLSTDSTGCVEADLLNFNAPPVKYVTDKLYQPKPQTTWLFKATFCENQVFLRNYHYFKITVALPNNLGWDLTNQVVLRAVPGSNYVPGEQLPPDSNVTAWVCNYEQTGLFGCPKTGTKISALVSFDHNVDQAYYFYVTSTNQAGTQFFFTMEFLDDTMYLHEKPIGTTKDFGDLQSVVELPVPMRYTPLMTPIEPIEMVQMFDSAQSLNHKDIKNGYYGCWRAEFCTDGMVQDKDYEIKAIVTPYETQSAAGFQSYLCNNFHDGFNRCDGGVPNDNPDLLAYDLSNQNTNVLTAPFDLSKGGSRIVGVGGNGGVYSPVPGVNKAGLTMIVQPK